MRFMNDIDIEVASDRYRDHPVLGPATITLANLARWADANGDGWHSWPAPARAAAKLMELIEADGTPQGQSENNPTVVQYRKALTPVKSFRTRHGANFTIVEA